MKYDTYSKKSTIAKIFLTIALTFLALTTVNTNAFASTNNSNNYEQTPLAANSYYITETVYLSKSYAIPPATYYVSHKKIGDFYYSGTLNRFSYADAADYWIVTYKGYVYAD